MSELERLKIMITNFRVYELQQLLVYSGKSKVGRKGDLLDRALKLLNGSPNTNTINKIKELNQHIANSYSIKNRLNFHINQINNNSNRPLEMHSLENFTNAPNIDITPLPNMSNINLQSFDKYVYPNVKFKPLPFYEKLADLIKPTTLVPTSLGNFVLQETYFLFKIPFEIVQDIISSKSKIQLNQKYDYGIQLQLRFCNINFLNKNKDVHDDQFPSNIQIKINGNIIPLPALLPPKAPLTEPKRPGRPLDITAHIFLDEFKDNRIDICWNNSYVNEINELMTHVMGLFVVRKFSTKDLLDHLLEKPYIRPATTRFMIREKLKINLDEEDSDISTTSLQISLLCPLSKCKMKYACRSLTCTHFQCFDAYSYLAMNEKNPKWTCPICSSPAIYKTLALDSLINEIIKECPESTIREVEFYRDATWKPVVNEPRNENDSNPKLKASVSSVQFGGQKKDLPSNFITDQHNVITSPNVTTDNSKQASKDSITAIILSSDEDTVPWKYYKPNKASKKYMLPISKVANLPLFSEALNTSTAQIPKILPNCDLLPTPISMQPITTTMRTFFRPSNQTSVEFDRVTSSPSAHVPNNLFVTDNIRSDNSLSSPEININRKRKKQKASHSIRKGHYSIVYSSNSEDDDDGFSLSHVLNSLKGDIVTTKNQTQIHKNGMKKSECEVIDLCSSPESSNFTAPKKLTPQIPDHLGPILDSLNDSFNRRYRSKLRNPTRGLPITDTSSNTINSNQRSLTPMEVETIGAPSRIDLPNLLTSASNLDKQELELPPIDLTYQNQSANDISTLDSSINPESSKSAIELADLEIAKNIYSLMRRDLTSHRNMDNGSSSSNSSLAKSTETVHANESHVNIPEHRNINVSKPTAIRKIDAMCTQLRLAKTSLKQGVTGCLTSSVSIVVNACQSLSFCPPLKSHQNFIAQNHHGGRRLHHSNTLQNNFSQSNINFSLINRQLVVSDSAGIANQMSHAPPSSVLKRLRSPKFYNAPVIKGKSFTTTSYSLSSTQEPFNNVIFPTTNYNSSSYLSGCLLKIPPNNYNKAMPSNNILNQASLVNTTIPRVAHPPPITNYNSSNFYSFNKNPYGGAGVSGSINNLHNPNTTLGNPQHNNTHLYLNHLPASQFRSISFSNNINHFTFDTSDCDPSIRITCKVPNMEGVSPIMQRFERSPGAVTAVSNHSCLH